MRNESLERVYVFVTCSFFLFSIPLPAESIKITLCHQSHSWGYLPPHTRNQLPQGSTSCHPVRPHKTTPWISLITLPPLPCNPRFHSPPYCSPVVCGDVDKTPSFFRSGVTISLVRRNGTTQKPHQFTPHILRSSPHYLSPIHIVSLLVQLLFLLFYLIHLSVSLAICLSVYLSLCFNIIISLRRN